MAGEQRMGLIDILAIGAVGVIGLGVIVPVGAASKVGSRSGTCADHLADLVEGVVKYANDAGSYPPSYVYAGAPAGMNWNMNQQGPASPNPGNGYIHWSRFLTEGGYIVGDDTFICPDVPTGGAPATNPGPNVAHWEPGQINDLGGGTGSPAPDDRQAKRMAYTANGALLPQNLFNSIGTPRKAQLVEIRSIDQSVDEAYVRQPKNTIVLTEFLTLSNGGFGGWSPVMVNAISKSHRPIVPFNGISAGVNVYQEPNAGVLPRFKYPDAGDILPTPFLGAGEIASQLTSLNAVGRHHPGATANFAFADGHVSQTTVQQSVAQRMWGQRFYSITGDNRVK